MPLALGSDHDFGRGEDLVIPNPADAIAESDQVPPTAVALEQITQAGGLRELEVTEHQRGVDRAFPTIPGIMKIPDDLTQYYDDAKRRAAGRLSLEVQLIERIAKSESRVIALERALREISTGGEFNIEAQQFARAALGDH